nr:C39 family peptidase [Micromonospora endolithica]
MAAHASPTENKPTAAVQPPPPPPEPPQQPPEDKRVLEYDYQKQPNGYYCAPAATRIALSTQGKVLPQKEVAQKLGTTEDGTNSANDTTRVLNEVTGGGYETTEIGGATATPAQVDKLRTDVVEAVDAKRGVVANTMGTGVDTEGDQHVFPSGHYVTIVGYRDDGDRLKVADPYDPEKHYWMTDQKLANWIAARGYSS